jgi:hypothetical protein
MRIYFYVCNRNFATLIKDFRNCISATFSRTLLSRRRKYKKKLSNMDLQTYRPSAGQAELLTTRLTWQVGSSKNYQTPHIHYLQKSKVKGLQLFKSSLLQLIRMSAILRKCGEKVAYPNLWCTLNACQKCVSTDTSGCRRRGNDIKHMF